MTIKINQSYVRMLITMTIKFYFPFAAEVIQLQDIVILPHSRAGCGLAGLRVLIIFNVKSPEKLPREVPADLPRKRIVEYHLVQTPAQPWQRLRGIEAGLLSRQSIPQQPVREGEQGSYRVRSVHQALVFDGVQPHREGLSEGIRV